MARHAGAGHQPLRAASLRKGGSRASLRLHTRVPEPGRVKMSRESGAARARVLVVEPPEHAGNTAQTLEAAGHDVMTATSGTEAMELARAGGFDVVLVDL